MISVAPRPVRFRRALRLFSSSHPSLTSPKSKKREEINFNPEVYFDDVPNPEHVNYKRLTSNDLEAFKHPPRRVKMLVRDYIEDSLYNPHYGYFSKRATIVTSPKHIDFATLRDSAEFQEEVAKRYASYGKDEPGPGKQLWHTPTEIFKVFHGLDYLRYSSLFWCVAVVRAERCQVHPDRISPQVLPLRRPRHLRDRSREWDSCPEHPRLHSRHLPASVRTDEVQYRGN